MHLTALTFAKFKILMTKYFLVVSTLNTVLCPSCSYGIHPDSACVSDLSLTGFPQDLNLPSVTVNCKGCDQRDQVQHKQNNEVPFTAIPGSTFPPVQKPRHYSLSFRCDVAK